MTDSAEAPKKVAVTKETLLARFIKLSGYRERDVLGINDTTRVVVTSNGGKYTFTKSGLRRLNGPPYPKEEVEEE
jgi:hypothetical protein